MCENHREDKFLRATNYRYYGSEEKANSKANAASKKHKIVKALSVAIAISIAAAVLVIPTTTLAPDADAFEDSRAKSLSIGNIDEFSIVITDNCIVPTTAPVTQQATTVAETTTEETTAAKATEKATEAEKTEPKQEASEAEVSVTEANEPTEVQYETNASEQVSDNSESTQESSSQSGNYLISISNPDSSYSPKHVSLSDYDRAKLERLVMGEAGSMGYTGCALVAQAIRDAMIRSGTSSIDRIISEYKYYAPTNKAPNSDVKNAVSFIFDQNGSAVQHRILCFNAGGGSWHDSQNYIVSSGNVKFYDLWY